MRRLLPILCITLLLSASCDGGPSSGADVVDYVNPLIGTDSSYQLSAGNTYPAIGMPWGMNYWTPQTGRNGSGWIYTYDSPRIRGFRQTPQPLDKRFLPLFHNAGHYRPFLGRGCPPELVFA